MPKPSVLSPAVPQETMAVNKTIAKPASHVHCLLKGDVPEDAYRLWVHVLLHSYPDYLLIMLML